MSAHDYISSLSDLQLNEMAKDGAASSDAAKQELARREKSKPTTPKAPSAQHTPTLSDLLLDYRTSVRVHTLSTGETESASITAMLEIEDKIRARVRAATLESMALTEAMTALYTQIHETVSFCDSNEFSIDMEISAGIGMLAQERVDLLARLALAEAACKAVSEADISLLPEDGIEELLCAIEQAGKVVKK